MTLRFAIVPALCALFLASSVARAQFPLMIPDSSNDRIMLFSGVDGSVIDLNWITDTAGTFVFSTPKEAAVVGDQIWVSDQVADAVHRFDFNRAYLGSITTDSSGAALDNIRGFGYDGRQVYLTRITGGPVVIDADTATSIGNLPITGSLFDAAPFGATDLLISSSTSDDVQRHNRETGAFINNFATDRDSPQQVNVLPDGSIIFTSAIADPGIEGVYHYNPDGTLRRYIDTQLLKTTFGEHVPQGAWTLGDGNYLVATSRGVYRYDVAGNLFTEIVAGMSAQYVNPFIPEPSCLGLLAGAGVLAMRLRRGRAD